VIRGIMFKPEAERELAEAYRWYEQRVFGLGTEFVRALDICVHQIQRHPEMFPVVYNNVRQAITRRFPTPFFTLSRRN